jgi:hypothetical protein
MQSVVLKEISMRKTLLVSAALLGMAVAAPAFAQPIGIPSGNLAPGTNSPNQTRGAAPGRTAPATGGMAPDVNGIPSGSMAPGSESPNQTMGASPSGPMVPATGGMAPDVNGIPSGSMAPGTNSPNQTMGSPPGPRMPAQAGSEKASNINEQTTRSTIAPRLAMPAMSAGAGPNQYLSVAKRAIASHRTGAAQEALERAETRALDRSTTAAAANTPDNGPVVTNIRNARHALASGDLAGADRLIDAAMTASQ